MLNAKIALAALVVLGATAGAAMSQEPPIRDQAAAPSKPDRRPVRVQVGINFFVAGPVDDGEEATKMREHARRTIYEMAKRECALLQDTIAAECRLESVTVNINRQMQHMGPMGQVEGFNTGGQVALQITLK